jgi:hypothetical protein
MRTIPISQLTKFIRLHCLRKESFSKTQILHQQYQFFNQTRKQTIKLVFIVEEWVIQLKSAETGRKIRNRVKNILTQASRDLDPNMSEIEAS